MALSQGERSRLYGGWPRTFHLNFCKSAMIVLVVWHLALSWSRITPGVSLPGSYDFNSLAKGDQGLRVKLGIHCCPMLQEVYQKGACLGQKKNISITFPELMWMALNSFGGDDPGCTGQEWIPSYLQIFTILCQTIKSKWPGMLTRGAILLHDNAGPHMTNTITALLQKFKWEVLGHLP